MFFILAANGQFSVFPVNSHATVKANFVVDFIVHVTISSKTIVIPFVDGNNGGLTISSLTANAYQPRMTINYLGNVGIGTTSPGYPLEIASTAVLSFAYQRTGVSAKKWGFDSDNSNTYWYNITDNVRSFTLSNGGNVGNGWYWLSMVGNGWQ